MENKGNIKRWKPESLCWDCANAVPTETLGCTWSRFLEPISGWDADDTSGLFRYSGSAYHVNSCPLFVAGASGASDKSDEAYISLGIAVVRQAAKDLISEYKRNYNMRMRNQTRVVLYGTRGLLNLYGNRYTALELRYADGDYETLKRFFHSDRARIFSQMDCSWLYKQIVKAVEKECWIPHRSINESEETWQKKQKKRKMEQGYISI